MKRKRIDKKKNQKQEKDLHGKNLKQFIDRGNDYFHFCCRVIYRKSIKNVESRREETKRNEKKKISGKLLDLVIASLSGRVLDKLPFLGLGILLRTTKTVRHFVFY